MPYGRTRIRRERICPWCSQSFTKDEHLARHIRTHTKEKPFVCDVCNRAFSRHDSLLRHSKSHQLQSSRSSRKQTTSVPENSGADADNCVQNMQNVVSQATPHLSDGISNPEAIHQPHDAHGDASATGNQTDQLHLFPQLPPGDGVDLSAPPRSCEWVAAAIGPEQSSNPYLGLGGNNANEDNLWGFDAVPLTPAWLASEDFDLDAFNSSIMASTTNWLLPPDIQVDFGTTNCTTQSPMHTRSTRREDLVRKQWFTYLSDIGTGYATPDVQEKTHVDEAYRKTLADKLHQNVPTMPLPSTDFLNLCIQMYFTRFHPIFPVVHAPSFRPSAQSSLLLLSICSVGSLFVGSSHASFQGFRIFETLNKAILASWEKYISRGEAEAIAMMQAALLGQTFGLLSGRPKDLLTAHTFHGTMVAWAHRSSSLRNIRLTHGYSSDKIAENPEKAWKMWILAEECSRLLAGIQIHDAEISQLFITEPFLRHSPSKRPVIADDHLWSAPTAGEWSKIIKHQSLASNRTPDSSDSHFFASLSDTSGLYRYLELEGIAASISEDRGSDTINKMNHCDALIRFYDSHLNSRANQVIDIHCLRLLWHSAFISIYVDFNRLELAVGREGFDEAQRHLDYVREWASSNNGRRCAMHAAVILHELETMKLGAEPAIHVPRVIFHAAIVWFCYTGLAPDSADVSHQTVEFPELIKMGINCQILIFEANGFKHTRPHALESSTLCGLVDILQRVGHWGISRKFASILTLLIEDKTESRDAIM